MHRNFNRNTSSMVSQLFTIYTHFLRQPAIANPSIQRYQRRLFVRRIGFKPNINDGNKMAVDSLVEIFTKKHTTELGDSVELSQLGFDLTHEVVESVLVQLRSWRVAYKFFIWAKSQDGYFHNCYTLNAMASILSSSRRSVELKSLVLDVMDSPYSCSYMSPGSLGFLIRCLGSVGLVNEATELFDKVREMGLCVPNCYSYNCLLEVLAKSGSSSLVEKRLDEMRGLRWMIDKYTLTPLLKVYCNGREFDKALVLFDEMFEKGWVDDHVLSVLLVSLSKWGEVDKAFEVIERMEGCNLRLNKKTFYVLVHGFVSNNRVDKALQLFDKMCLSGISPDIAVYDVLIGGLCSKDPQGALSLYLQMKSSGICPDLSILNKIISGVTDEEVMVNLLEESGVSLDDKSIRSLFNSVLNGLVKNDLVDRALDLVKVMMEDPSENGSRLEKFFKLNGNVSLDSSSFSIIINALCHKSRTDEALELFTAMDTFGCPKDTTLYNNLIDSLCNADRVTDSLDLLREMKKLDIKTTQFTYNSIYGYFCRKGDVTGATIMLKEMCVDRYEPWIKNSTTLVKQLCKQGRAREASNFLDETLQMGLVPHIIPYSAVISGLFKLQEVDGALELFHNVCSRGYRPDVVLYNILINGLSKASRMAEAENMLKEMLSSGLLPSTVTYNSLIDGWCTNGDIDQAMSCLPKMVGEDREPNVITYTTMIDELCNAERPDDALKLWNEMGEKSCSPNRITFMAMISGLCKNNMPDMALTYLHEMSKKELKADLFVYVALMDSFLLNKNPVMALEMLKEIVEKNMFPAPADQNHTLVKDAITKLADDPLTSMLINLLLKKASQ